MLLAEGLRCTPLQQSPVTSVLSIRTLGMNGAACTSYSSRLQRLQHAQAGWTGRPIYAIMSALALTRPSRYISKLRCLSIYLWPAASVTSDEVRGTWSGVRSSMVSVFLSDTVSPAASKTVMYIFVPLYYYILLIVLDLEHLQWRCSVLFPFFQRHSSTSDTSDCRKRRVACVLHIVGCMRNCSSTRVDARQEASRKA